MFLTSLLLCSILPVTILADPPLITYNLSLPITLKELLGYKENALLYFTDLVSKYGYKADEHKVTTEDGYILTTFRMAGANCSTVSSATENKKNTLPVILLHGILNDAYTFLDAGSNASLAYLLADSCYDVWVPNVRGTADGRAHLTLDPDEDASFWKFSIDEFGYYDVPAFIDYVLNVTGSEKVNYIAHSQGSAALAITLSERPEYNDKINLNIGLAPAIKINKMRSPLVRLVLIFYYLLEDVLDVLGFQEVLFRGGLVQVLLELICHDVTLTKPICLAIQTLVDSFDPGSILNDALILSYAHMFAGQSVQQFVHFNQWLWSGNFSKYDYGATKNLEVYGTEWSELYNLTNVKVPTLLFSGKNDNLVVTENIEWTAKQLPNLLELYYVSDPNWNHIDFIYSHRIPTLVYPKLNEYLSAYSKI